MRSTFTLLALVPMLYLTAGHISAEAPATPQVESPPPLGNAPRMVVPTPGIASHKEVLDTSDATLPEVSNKLPAEKSIASAPVATVNAHASDSAPAPLAVPESKPVPEPVPMMAPLLSKLDLGGTVQVKGFYHNFAADKDVNKQMSLTLRRFKLDLDGAVDSHFGFKGALLLDGNNKSFGIDDAYLYYTISDLVGFKGGKVKRPFSQEALQSSKSLFTIERGELYHNFLANTTGYAYYDVGLIAYGGFTEEGRTLGYEIGVFNGKQNDNPNKDYSGQQYEGTDKGFKAKDVVMRINATPFAPLKLEAAISTKAAEDTTNPSEFSYSVNTAYEFGLNFVYQKFRFLGEVSWGDNHNQIDARIIKGSSLFFAFYATGVWREEYTAGRASELVVKVEGIDPDFEPGKGEGKPNDGKVRYTVGSNYFFTPRVSLLVDYGLLQPITEVTGEKDLNHNIDVMWRLSF